MAVGNKKTAANAMNKKEERSTLSKVAETAEGAGAAISALPVPGARVAGGLIGGAGALADVFS